MGKHEREAMVADIIGAMRKHYAEHGESGCDFIDAARYLEREASDEELKDEHGRWVE